jgi:hypothetical protein
MEMSPDEIQDQLITEIDVLYGSNVPWYGFKELSPPTTEEQEKRLEKVTLLYRKGVPRGLHLSPHTHAYLSIDTHRRSQGTTSSLFP